MQKSLDKRNQNSVTEALQVPPWKLLIVDDDREVHSITRLVLKDLLFEGRSLKILHAYDLDRATELVQENPDIALLLLEAVLNNETDGLQLVNTIRNKLDNQALRIILRTGYSSRLPEDEIITQYDINDYKRKSELTARKLVTTIISSLRAYQTIHALEMTKQGMEVIIENSDKLFEYSSVQAFASGILTQLSAFLKGDPDGILCVRLNGDKHNTALGKAFRDMDILGSTGRLQYSEKMPATQHTETHSALLLAQRAFAQKQTLSQDKMLALFLCAPNVPDAVAVLKGVKGISEEDLTLLRYFSTKISLALANVIHYSKYQKAQQAASIDFLTKLPNRREFINIGEQLLSLCKHSNKPLALAMIDLDFFKDINDRYGHEIGDRVLQHFSSFVKNHIRDKDLFARVGGEEFCLLLPRTQSAETGRILHRLCEQVANTVFEVKGEQIHLTISIGADQQVDNLQDMMSRADKRLYQAKNSGRSRVILSDDREKVKPA